MYWSTTFPFQDGCLVHHDKHIWHEKTDLGPAHSRRSSSSSNQSGTEYPDKFRNLLSAKGSSFSTMVNYYET